MHRPSLGWVAVVLAVGLGTPEGLRAEEGKPPAAMETRAYPVHVLLRGHPRHRMDRGPFPTASWMVNDEASPLFGSESEERGVPFGSLLDAIKAEVGTADDWEREGVSLAQAGDRLLIVRGPRDLQTQVGAWLERAARADLRTAVVDVAAFQGDAAAGRGEGGVAAAVASGAWAALGAVRMAVEAGGSATARAGTLRAYVQDYDVEVAEDGNTADPIVGVLPEGLAVEAEATSAGSDRISLRLRGWWASPATWAPRTTGEGDRIEVPTSQGASFDATLTTGDGTWTPLAASGGVVFAARARVEGLPSSAASEGVLLPSPPTPPSGSALVLRSYDVRDLVLPIAPARGTPIDVPPSNYVPPKPPGLPEASPPIEFSVLLDLVKAPAAAWERDGASAEAAGNVLRVRTDAAHQAQIAALLDRLREALLPTTRLRATVLALPWASLPEWWSGLSDDLLREGAAPLRTRPGARVVATGGLRLRDGERRTSVAGTERSYVADFDVEIAKASAIGDPVVQTLLDGTSLDVEHDGAFPARAANVVLRLDVGRVLEVREVPTRHGAIECPVLGLRRTRSELVVPWGTTRVAAVWATGPQVHLVLLTANRE